MSELQVIINSPIGAVFFVSGAISVLVLLGILILKKGNELHSILGYIFCFGLCFTNYAATVSYYEGYLPLAAISITVPISTLSLFLGMAAIIPKSKSKLRIRIHIIFNCIAATSVGMGVIINWYHFNVLALDIFNWSNYRFITFLSLPILGIGIIITYYFLLQTNKYFGLTLQTKSISEFDLNIEEAVHTLDIRTQTILVKKEVIEQNEEQSGLRSST